MKTTLQVLARPLQVVVMTGVGLTAALVSDGAGDVIGWLCLGYVVALAVRCAFGPPRTGAGRAID